MIGGGEIFVLRGCLLWRSLGGVDLRFRLSNKVLQSVARIPKMNCLL